MKKLLLTFAALCVCFAAGAQTSDAANAGERSEWLTTFTSVSVNAPADVEFVQVPVTEAPRIAYDTKGSYTSKFKFEIKDKALYITEKDDSRRLGRTTVKVYYNTLESAVLENAVVTFARPLEAVMFDLTVGGDAQVTLPVEVKDLKAEISGRSRVTLSGAVKYLSIFLSSGVVNATELEVTAAQVNVQSSGEARLWVTDRLEAKTTTKGKITYKGAPGIVRTSSSFLGGTIAPQQ